MKKVYENIDFTMVGYYQSLLEGEGINTDVRNSSSSALTGLIGGGQCYPELWVVNDHDFDQACHIICNSKDGITQPKHHHCIKGLYKGTDLKGRT